MRFQNDAVVAYLNNQPVKVKGFIVSYLPGTMITFAQICKRSRGYTVITRRNRVGRKVKQEKLRFNNYDEARSFVESIYGV